MIYYAFGNTGNVISHHGVKGQKWGVRRKTASSSRVSTQPGTAKKSKTSPESAVSERSSRSREKSWTSAYRRRSQMTNEQLKQQVDRLRLESEFKRLSSDVAKSNKPKSFIQKFADNTLSEIGTQVPKALVGAAISAALGTSGNKQSQKKVSSNPQPKVSTQKPKKKPTKVEFIKPERVKPKVNTKDDIFDGEYTERYKDYLPVIRHDDSDDDDVISHHGVKGMKWGVRNVVNYAKTGQDGQDVAGGGNDDDTPPEDMVAEGPKGKGVSVSDGKGNFTDVSSVKDLQKLNDRQLDALITVAGENTVDQVKHVVDKGKKMLVKFFAH